MMDITPHSDFFAGNRARLRSLFTGTAPIVLTANGLLQRGGDSAYGFAQEANFWYLTGIEEPDVVLVLDRDKEYLIVPSRTASREAFDGTIDQQALVQRSGVSQVYDDKAGWDQLGTRLKKVKHVATLAAPPAYVEQYGMYTNPARVSLLQRIHTYNHELETLDISQHLARMRMIKQPVEVDAIQAAIDITGATIKEAVRASKLAKYAYEYEIEAQITAGFRKRGSSGHAFEPIVAAGKQACILHNVANNAPLAADELLLLDIGAEVSHYAADISRTVSLSTPSRRQQLVFNAVLEVQSFALDLMKPGTMLRDYEREVAQFMGEKLRELGLIRTISNEAIREYYPHATSHFLGLNVHDIGDYDRPLEAGVVLTVEPGIYIPQEGIGVRIEDDVLITPDGHRVLSNALPRSLV